MKNSPSIQKKARNWVNRLAREYAIADSGGGLALEELERALITELSAEEVLGREGHFFEDRFHQKRVHPLAAVARDARAQVLAALRVLNLDLEPLHPGPGRPPEKGIS